MKRLLIIGFSMLALAATAQVNNTDSTTNEPLNSVNNIIKGNSSKNITVGTYAQIDYNQQIAGDTRYNGNLDVHRLVLFLGYKFNDRTHFVTEVEYEHVTEVYVEQAFLNYQIRPEINFRAGLLLIPMGIINEYHEPTTFNGVERPNLDGQIVPSTWREMGVGFSGNFPNLSLKYQAYVVNGFDGYSDGSGALRGQDAFRKGRQKAAKSYMSSPNLSTKIDYYGITGLKLGLAGYFGNSQSELFDGVGKNDAVALSQADSSVVKMAMIGLDARYQNNGFQARAQVINAKISNTSAYNAFTNKDLGSGLFGYYVEAGYDVLRFFNIRTNKKLVAFTRYEQYNTHDKVSVELAKNAAYDRTDITTGLGFWLSNGAVLKADYQVFKNEDKTSVNKRQINLGLGIWF
jgi:hypothetical protein